MSTSGSVSQWLEDLKTGDSSAATFLWNRYQHNLLRFARHRLHNDVRRFADEEDLVMTAFGSFVCRAVAGQFPDLSSRKELWALLVTITDRKAVNVMRKYLSRKRGAGRVRGGSTFAANGEDVDSVVARAGNCHPQPDVAACLSEMFDALDDDMRQIVGLRMDGFTNEEIGQRLNRSVATIERRLRLLRDQWLEELFG